MLALLGVAAFAVLVDVEGECGWHHSYEIESWKSIFFCQFVPSVHELPYVREANTVVDGKQQSSVHFDVSFVFKGA